MTYAQKLIQLKHEISIIRKKIKNKFKKHQKVMIKFIHNEIDIVEIKVPGKTIVLKKGDAKKGFIHLLTTHYKENDLETMDILNLPIMFQNAMQLANKGISNNALTVYKRFKNQKEHILVTDETRKDRLVVTTYRKT